MFEEELRQIDECDAFYDRGSTFWLNCFLNEWVPSPKTIRISILFRKMICLNTWAIGLSLGMQLGFC